MEDRIGWIQKDRKTDDGVVLRKIRTNSKDNGVIIEEAQDRITCRLKTRCAERK